MKVGNSIKKICKDCKIFYRFKKLYRICLLKKHKKRQK